MSDSIQNLNDESLRGAISSFCAGAAGLAEGTNAGTIQTANAVDYAIDGILYTKAATDNIAVTAAAQQAESTKCMYLVSVNAAGAVTVTKGDTVASTGSAYLPDLPENSAPLGAIRIVTDNATTFTAGTTDIGAAGITETFYDLAHVNVGAF